MLIESVSSINLGVDLKEKKTLVSVLMHKRPSRTRESRDTHSTILISLKSHFSSSRDGSDVFRVLWTQKAAFFKNPLMSLSYVVLRWEFTWVFFLPIHIHWVSTRLLSHIRTSLDAAVPAISAKSGFFHLLHLIMYSCTNCHHPE